VANLRTHLTIGDCTIPHGIAKLAAAWPPTPPSGPLCTRSTTAGHWPMWIHIAEQISGQVRVEALGLAAIFSFRGGNHSIAATVIGRADVAARCDHIEFPPSTVPKLDYSKETPHTPTLTSESP
jgi:hypothetical protein